MDGIGDYQQGRYGQGPTVQAYWARKIINNTGLTCKVTMDGDVYVRESGKGTNGGDHSVYLNLGKTFLIKPNSTITLKAVKKADLGYSRAKTSGLICGNADVKFPGGCDNY